MRNWVIAVRSLFRKGRHNEIKILSLGVGLAMGLVLIAKVCFELSYDDFYPDADRVYQIQENFVLGERRMDGIPQVSGGVAPGMKAEIPGVESATRVERLGHEVFFTPDRKKYEGEFSLADTNFYDVLSHKVIAGNVKEILSRPLYAMVSEKMARTMGQGKEVVGLSFELSDFPGRAITIGGIFEDLPENTHLSYDVMVSLDSFEKLYGWSCTDGWFGCDRFASYVKLEAGIDTSHVMQPMAEMLDRHVDSAKLEESGIKYKLTLQPLKEVYAQSPATKSMAVMLSLIAFAILFAALMNYVLLVISSLVTRTKDIAVHKCYGASGWNISDMIFSETFLNLLASLIVSVLLILTFRGTVEELLKASLGALFTVETLLLIVGVCLLIFLLAGLIPSRLFSRIPVAAAFRTYNESRRIWKKILLFIQFIAVGFLVSLLVIIGLQYRHMITENPGYSYDQLAYCPLEGVNGSNREIVANEVAKMPEVEGIATCSYLPIFAGSGNMIKNPENTETLLHFTDLYSADANYIPLMQIPVLAGKAFDNSYTDSSRVVMISRMTEEKLALLLDWKDGAVGKTIYIDGHGPDRKDYEVIGVYDNIRIGAINSELMEPTILFFSRHTNTTLAIKFHELTSENMKQVMERIQKLLPNKDVIVTSYEASLINQYADSRLFRNSIMLGGFVTLLITLIGLIGYITDETNRRSKEIAVRKINGATVMNILTIISKDVLYMAVPAVILGVMGSYLMGENWLQQFSDKIPLSIFIFIGSAVIIWLLVLAIVVMRTWKIANDNPVDSLKSE